MYTKLDVTYPSAKKPVNVMMIEKKGSIIRNFFQSPLIVEVWLNISEIDKNKIENIVMWLCACETKSIKVFFNLGSQSSLFPKYCSNIPEGFISDVRYTYTRPKVIPRAREKR